MSRRNGVAQVLRIMADPDGCGTQVHWQHIGRRTRSTTHEGHEIGGRARRAANWQAS